jgi:hypothetical protein
MGVVRNIRNALIEGRQADPPVPQPTSITLRGDE